MDSLVYEKYDEIMNDVLGGGFGEGSMKLVDELAAYGAGSERMLLGIYVICVDREMFEAADYIKKRITGDRMFCTAVMLYNDAQRESTIQHLLNKKGYYFGAAMPETDEEMYHMIKNGCYEILDSYLERLSWVMANLNQKDMFSKLLLVAAKNRDNEAIETFARHDFCFCEDDCVKIKERDSGYYNEIGALFEKHGNNIIKQEIRYDFFN